MEWLSNRYYIKNANDDRKGLKQYIMPRYYLIDDFNGMILLCSTSLAEIKRFYNVNKNHLVWKKVDVNEKLIHN